MEKLSVWVGRILKAMLRAFLGSWGNPVVAEVAAVTEVAAIAVEEVQHGGESKPEAQSPAQQTEKRASENTDAAIPIPVEQATVKPGPTVFDKPVDSTYGKNRKH
jgi:hypothetical protein